MRFDLDSDRGCCFGDHFFAENEHAVWKIDRVGLLSHISPFLPVSSFGDFDLCFIAK